MFPYFYNLFIPPLPNICQKPPTLYSLLKQMVEDEDYVYSRDLAKETRSKVFDFDYNLSSKVNKEEFETLILNHFLMRRIGYETYSSWYIAFRNKIKEIVPIYNKLFDSLENWDLFNDGEEITRQTSTVGTDSVNSESNVDVSTTTDVRSSNTPQNEIEDIKNGNYVSDYSYDQGTSNTNGSSSSTTNNNQNVEETIKRTPIDKISLFKEYKNNVESIYSMIYKDLDDLFFQVID